MQWCPLGHIDSVVYGRNQSYQLWAELNILGLITALAVVDVQWLGYICVITNLLTVIRGRIN